MIGNLEPEENVMRIAEWVEKLNSALNELGWTSDDDIRVKIGGVANSGIHQTEGANPRWAKPFGTKSVPFYNLSPAYRFQFQNHRRFGD